MMKVRARVDNMYDFYGLDLSFGPKSMNMYEKIIQCNYPEQNIGILIIL